jgi:hypothetical protein
VFGKHKFKNPVFKASFFPIPPRPALPRSHPTRPPTLSRTPPQKRPPRMYYDSRTSPQHQVMRQDLYDFVQHSSKRLKLCEADVLQYHQQFLVLSNPLVRAHYLTVEEHDTEFWYGFHPDNCTELYPHLCRAVPRWPRDTPFDMNDVFTNAREIFMIKLPWLQKSHSEAPNTKHEPANLFEPVSVLTSLPPSTPPPPLAPTPHPSPERPPEIHRPTSAPPVTQLFNDLGEGDLCPQVDLGDLPGTCHGSDAHETPCTSPPPSSCILFTFAFAHPFAVVASFFVTLLLNPHPSLSRPSVCRHCRATCHHHLH